MSASAVETTQDDRHIGAMANVDSDHNLSSEGKGRRRDVPLPTPREIGDVASGICRLVRAMARRFEPDADPRLGGDPPGLEDFRRIRDAWDETLDRIVPMLREQGYSDREIGEALGITQQAVSKRWVR
jgi:hypothetical protein